MIWTILDGLMILFALGSGVSKVIGIQIERQGAEQLGVHYNYLIIMGVLQLLSIPMIYFKQYVAVVVLLGLPYLLFVYVCAAHKQYGFAALCFMVFSVTVIRCLAPGLS